MKDNIYNFFENIYKNNDKLLEDNSNSLINKYIEHIPKGRVLDLGVGDGRNAIFLSKKGFMFEGVDISDSLVRKLKDINELEKLGIDFKVCDVRKFDIIEDSYTFIICTSVMHFFRKAEVKELIENMKKGLKIGGYVYISVFSTQDPTYAKRLKSNKVELVGDNEIYLKEEGIFRSYYSKDEMLSYFDNIEMVSYSDSYFLDLSHGEPHYHGSITYLGKKVL